MTEFIKADYHRFSSFRKQSLDGREASTGRMTSLLAYAFGLHALAVFRFGQWIEGRGAGGAPGPARPARRFLGAIQRGLAAGVRAVYDIRIHADAEIGKGCLIEHFGGIAIGPCRIGEHCSIYQQVAIGEPGVPRGRSGLAGRPVIGDRVWIGPYVKILPGVRIGNGATILAGSVVDRDVPPGVLAGGNPARILRRGYDNSGLLL
jgi:serine acetyltransferase